MRRRVIVNLDFTAGLLVIFVYSLLFICVNLGKRNDNFLNFVFLELFKRSLGNAENGNTVNCSADLRLHFVDEASRSVGGDVIIHQVLCKAYSDLACTYDGNFNLLCFVFFVNLDVCKNSEQKAQQLAPRRNLVAAFVAVSVCHSHCKRKQTVKADERNHYCKHKFFEMEKRRQSVFKRHKQQRAQRIRNQEQNIALDSAVSPNLLINLKDKSKKEYTAERQ